MKKLPKKIRLVKGSIPLKNRQPSGYTYKKLPIEEVILRAEAYADQAREAKVKELGSIKPSDGHLDTVWDKAYEEMFYKLGGTMTYMKRPSYPNKVKEKK